jgi:hypothetical protein
MLLLSVNQMFDLAESSVGRPMYSIDLLEPRRLLSANPAADFAETIPSSAVSVNGTSYFTANEPSPEPSICCTRRE